MKRCLLIAIMMTGLATFARAAETTEPPKPAAQTTDDRIAALEKVLLKKLAAIEDRLDKLEKDRMTQQQADDRKADQLARDVADIRRSVQRIESRK